MTKVRTQAIFRCGALGAVLAGALAAGEATPSSLPGQIAPGGIVPVEHVVNSRNFEVTVVPVDHKSKDTRAADVYMSRYPGEDWSYAGAAAPAGEGAPSRFRGAFSVVDDGVYYITSRGIDDAGKAPPPPPGAAAQARVIVDTTRPRLTLVDPLGHETLRVGQTIAIRWQAQDENFSEVAIRIEYSTDDGATWASVRDGTANDGTEDWTVPETGGRPVMLRIRAVDRAGNEASVTTAGSLRVAAAATAGAQPTPETRRALETAGAVGAPPRKETGPETKFPEMDANAATPAYHDRSRPTSSRAAYIAYVMAGNLVRQGRLKDSLQYYRTAVDADETFDEAWNDAGLIYRQLGAWDMARSCLGRALGIDGANPVYHHNRGEIDQIEGLELLGRAQGEEERAHAMGIVRQAVEHYGRAIAWAQKQGILAETAASYFRLAEICYHANRDPAGARQYWWKVTSLHSPTPDLDNVIHDQGTPAEARTREIYRYYTQSHVTLETWQHWARGYLDQLDAMERSGQLPKSSPQAPIRIADIHPLPAVPETPEAPRPGAVPPDYVQPAYGRRPEPGTVQSTLPPVAEAQPKRRSLQFSGWRAPEAEPQAAPAAVPVSAAPVPVPAAAQAAQVAPAPVGAVASSDPLPAPPPPEPPEVPKYGGKFVPYERKK